MTRLSDMSFREKSTWISFVLLLALSIAYFWNFTLMLMDRPHSDVLFPLLVLAFVVGQLILQAAIAIRSPREARAPKDERERLIDLKATRVAFLVLMTGAFTSVGTMHLRVNRFEMGQFTLLAIVVAELVLLGTRLVLYRRDA
jgi:hypothetical protein